MALAALSELFSSSEASELKTEETTDINSMGMALENKLELDQ